MRIADLARRAGVATSAIRWYERAGVLPSADRQANGYRDYTDLDVSRLRLVVALRRLGLGPEDAGRLARLCLERGEVDTDLRPLLAQQREGIARQRADLDRLEGELVDLEATIRGAAQPRSATRRPVEPASVLFVCRHNSARSQIAEALLRDYGGADFAVASAGTEAGAVHPMTVQVLREEGIDWSRASAKPIGQFLDRHFDYVVTVCDRARQCPTFPGSENTLHWGLDDPAEVDGTDEQKLDAFRATLMEISMRLRPFVEIARRTGRSDRALGTDGDGFR